MLAWCTKIVQLGQRWTLGELAGGGFGIWSAAGGSPLVTYPNDGEGWETASGRFRQLEAGGTGSGSTGTRAAVLAIAVIVIGYWIMHSYVYRGCVVGPGFFQWPNACI